SQPIRPEKYNLPAEHAEERGIKGIVYLSLSFCRDNIVIDLDRSEYFSDKIVDRTGSKKYKRKHRSTHVQAELIHRSRDRSDSSGRRESRRNYSTILQRYRTNTISNSDEPTFNKRFNFELDERNHHDVITIRVIEKVQINEYDSGRFELGCFTFHISQIRKMAQQIPYNDGDCLVEVLNNGFFILDPAEGRETSFAMSKVVKQYSFDT
ncbi:hypothetical protein PMAYCL1PPCAC_31967, partial [Pristionchus mayeri]